MATAGEAAAAAAEVEQALLAAPRQGGGSPPLHGAWEATAAAVPSANGSVIWLEDALLDGLISGVRVRLFIFNAATAACNGGGGGRRGTAGFFLRSQKVT
jgi:hypothetical protein